MWVVAERISKGSEDDEKDKDGANTGHDYHQPFHSVHCHNQTQLSMKNFVDYCDMRFDENMTI